MTRIPPRRRAPSPRTREFFSVDRAPGRQILDLRGLGLDPVRLLGRYRYTSAHDELAPHSHGEMIEICFLESGRQTYEVGGRTYSMAGGDVFVTFPGERHGSGPHPEARGVLYWLLLSVPAARRSLLGLPRAEGRAVLQRLLDPPRRHFRGGERLRAGLRAVFDMHAAFGDPLRRTALRILLLRILLDVIAGARRRRPSFTSAHVRTAQRHIDDHIEEPLPLGDLAAHVGLSLPRLKSKFRREIGIPPADYIARRRIERAARLLFETQRPVTDIALALGFSSSQYFATVFKRYTRCTPREARRSRVYLS